MRIIIIGAGQVGRHLAQILSEEQQDVYVVEQDEKIVRQLEDKLDAQVIHGSGISRETLFRAGVTRADLLLAVTHIDEVNLIAAMTAEKLHPECRTVARVRDTRFLQGTDTLKAEEYGVDLLLSPEQAMADQVVRVLQYDGPGQVSALPGGLATLLELPVPPHSTLAYATLEEFNTEMPPHSIVIAALGKDQLRIPKPDDRFQVGERIFFLCVPGEINDILQLAGSDTHHVKRVLLIGGGDTGLHIALALRRLKFNVTVIEQDRDRAEELATRLDRCTIITGDGIDPESIAEQIADGQDAIVVVIDDDSKSLLAAITAKHLGGNKVIARVDNQAYAPMARKLGIDAMISPRRAVANAILTYVRRSHITSTTMLGNHEGELLVFEIDSKSNKKLTEVPVGELKLPKHCKVGLIIRNDEVLVSDPAETTFQMNDHVFIVAMRDAVPKLEEVFG